MTINHINRAALAQAYGTTGLTPDQPQQQAADASAEQAGTALQNQSGQPPAAARANTDASPEHGHPSGTDAADSGAPQDTASFNLETLAAAVGLDPDELLDQVKSGQGVSDLLSKTGQTGYGSTAADAITGGILLDFYA